MKILLVSPYIPWEDNASSIGGGPLSIHKTAMHLTECGHLVTVIYPTRCNLNIMKCKIPSDVPYNVVLVPDGKLIYACYSVAQAVQSLIKKQKFDILHVQSYKGILAQYLCKSYCPTIAMTHHAMVISTSFRDFSDKIFDWKWGLTYLYLERQTCRIADCVVVASEYMRKQVIENGNVPFERTRVVYNSIDREMIEEGLRIAEHKNGIPKRILFVGRLTRAKGADVLLQAMAILVKKGFDIQLDMVGPGEQKPYKAQAKRLKISPQVIFHGAVSNVRIRDFYREADIFILPSECESFGIANAEAMAFSIPVVSTRVGAIPEVVEDRVTGLLVPPNNSEKLANAIEYLIKNPDVAETMGRNGMKRVKEKFLWDKNIEKLERIYIDVRQKWIEVSRE